MQGHKLLLAKPHLALVTNLNNLKSQGKRDRITLINICVFKSANIAVCSLLWHPPGHNLE